LIRKLKNAYGGGEVGERPIILSPIILIIFTIYPIIFTGILIYIDIVCVENYLAVDYITSQGESRTKEG